MRVRGWVGGLSDEGGGGGGGLLVVLCQNLIAHNGGHYNTAQSHDSHVTGVYVCVFFSQMR